MSADANAAGSAPAEQAAGVVIDAGAVVELDVRDMDPPEPMVLTLAALEHLPADATLVQINTRVPQHLLPQLEARGFSYTVSEEAGVVRVAIRHHNAAAPQGN